jgi:hypothetical protein
LPDVVFGRHTTLLLTVVQAMDLVTGEALVLATADSVETTTKARGAIQKYRSIILTIYRIRTLSL